MSIDAVALLRIPDFSPSADLDVRELEDGFLLYLEQPFDADDDALLIALDDALGDALDDHEDDRGVFVLPDAADPDADSYDAVLEAVGEAGRFLALDGEGQSLHEGMQDVLVQAMQAMGLGDAEDVGRMLSGDPDAMMLAQIRMQRAIEETMSAAQEPTTPTVLAKPGEKPE